MEHKICLLVDDDPDELIIFEEALRDLQRPVHVIFDNNSELAVKKLKRGNFVPDYIFLDINMPKVNGWECLIAIQDLPHLAHIPIVIYSTTPPATKPEKANALRISEMMTKAATVNELTRKLDLFFSKTEK